MTFVSLSIMCKYVVSKITRGVSLGGLAIYIKKCLNAKEESWKLKYYFTMQKI
jgi:hypothetical protein